MTRPLTRPARLLGWLHLAPGQPRLTATAQLGWRGVWPVALLGLLVAGIVVGARVGLPTEFDATAPFTVGAHWGLAEELAAQGGPVTSGGQYGYDGQWFLGLAYDPLLQTDIAATFDRPQYRAQRPLFSVAGWLLAGGQPAVTAYTLLLVQMLVVGLGCAACARVVSAYGRSRWWGLLFAVIPGVVVGVAYGTAEPMAMALAALGLSLLLDRRFGWAGVAFAGAALTKETYLAFAAVAAVYLVVDALAGRDPDRRVAVRHAAVVVVPGTAALAAWWWYVSMAAPDSQRTPNHLLEVPFAGWARVFATIARGDYPSYRRLGPVLLVATFVLLVVALVVALQRRQSLLAYAVFLWSAFGLALVSIMLERFLSSQRVLAPSVLAAGLFLFSVWRPPGSPVSPRESGRSGPPAAPSSR